MPSGHHTTDSRPAQQAQTGASAGAARRRPRPERRVERALLLRRFPYAESSLVVQVLGQVSGRVHLVAKGAYRPKSATYGILDLFDTLELEWTHAGERELQTLRRAAILVRRRGVHADLERYRAGLTTLELAGLAAQPGSDTRALFESVTEALDSLAAGLTPPLATLCRFELDFLGELGLSPALSACAACGRPAPALPPTARRGPEPRVAFSAGAGGRLCHACAADAQRAGRRVGTLPERILSIARAFCERDPSTAQLAPEELLRVRDFVARFVEFHLESRPKTYKTFLAAPNRNAAQP